MRTRAPDEYTHRMSFVLPPALFEAVQTEARSRMQSLNSWLRQACLAQLSRSKEPEIDVQQRR